VWGAGRCRRRRVCTTEAIDRVCAQRRSQRAHRLQNGLARRHGWVEAHKHIAREGVRLCAPHPLDAAQAGVQRRRGCSRRRGHVEAHAALNLMENARLLRDSYTHDPDSLLLLSQTA
jgi:hypothetical protein